MVEVPGFEPDVPCEAKLLTDADLIECQLVGTSKPEKVPETKRGQSQTSGQHIGNPYFRAVRTGIVMRKSTPAASIARFVDLKFRVPDPYPWSYLEGRLEIRVRDQTAAFSRQ
jgi:hypothetical protein